MTMKSTLIQITLISAVGITVFTQPALADATSNNADSAMSGPALRTPDVSLTVSRRHRLGAGVILGEPTGATLKYWLNDNLALDTAIGASFDEDTDLNWHADALWHVFNLFPVSKGSLPLYFGAGVRAKFRDNQDDRWGVRIPVGIAYLFEDAPVDVFLEAAPVIDFTPETRGSFNVSAGVRYWF